MEIKFPVLVMMMMMIDIIMKPIDIIDDIPPMIFNVSIPFPLMTLLLLLVMMTDNLTWLMTVLMVLLLMKWR